MNPVLELSCSLGAGRLDVEIDARSAGAVLGVFGPSGAGKSSWLAGLAGLREVRSARAVVRGDVLFDSAAGNLPPVHRRGVGVVFQDHRLLPHRTVLGNLRYGMGSGRPGPTLDEVVELLDLEPLLENRPAACSGGERQRVALGRALLAAPRLLLLDEPLASLDRGLRREILPYLRAAAARFDLAMVYVSHELDELLSFDGDVLLVEEGRAVACGPVHELALREDCLERLHDEGLLFKVPGRLAQDREGGLAWVELAGGERVASGAFEGPRPGDGGEVELLLRPEDVILARPPFEGRVSLTNQLEGTVARVARTPARTLVEVRLAAGGPALLAEVTERAVERLQLAPGEAVAALFKAQATRCRARAVTEA